MLFLHSQGYTYMTIPKLTYPEINLLIKAKNKRVKEQQRQAKKNKLRNKHR